MTNGVVATPGEPMILVVDDLPQNRILLKKILTSHGYRFQAAEDGEAALSRVVEQMPDLILLDIVMPGMDGYQTCESLKSDPRFAAIPIIFLSALEEVLDKVKGFSVGGVDYITKPFLADEVIARIRTHLTIAELRQQLQAKVEELEHALEHVKTLNGLLPICAYCKNVRDDEGYWQQVEVYIRDHSSLQFSHGICPKCVEKHFPGMLDKDRKP